MVSRISAWAKRYRPAVRGSRTRISRPRAGPRTSSSASAPSPHACCTAPSPNSRPTTDASSDSVPCSMRVGSERTDRKSTRLNSSHSQISYAVFCLNQNRFDFPSGVNPRKPLPAVDLHEREQPERAHLAVGFWEIVISFAIEDVKCFERRIGSDELNTARDLEQIQIAHALGSLAVVACESLEEVTRFIVFYKFSMTIENFIIAVMLTLCG